MVSIVFFRRPTWWERFRGKAGRLQCAVGVRAAGFRLVIEARKGGWKVIPRAEWRETARLISEYLASYDPQIEPLLRDVASAPDVMAAALLKWTALKGFARLDGLEIQLAEAEDALAACLASRGFAKLAP